MLHLELESAVELEAFHEMQWMGKASMWCAPIPITIREGNMILVLGACE